MSVAIGTWNRGLSLGRLVSLTDDGSGSWVFANPGIYGLSDDGAGGWVWSATPDYRLDAYTLKWART
jgi:hypothetical protein